MLIIVIDQDFSQVVGTLFTHHQKCLLVDTQALGNNRKITAFLGGLDLCDGRYDTPEHRIYRDLDTVFANDIHNPTFPVSACFSFGAIVANLRSRHICCLLINTTYCADQGTKLDMFMHHKDVVYHLTLIGSSLQWTSDITCLNLNTYDSWV